MSFCCCFRLGNSGLERSQPAKFVGRGEGYSGLVAPLCKALVEVFQSMYRPTNSQLQDMPKSEDKVYQMCIIYHPLVLALAIIIRRIFSRFPAIISSLSEVRSPLIFAHIRAAGPSGSSGAKRTPFGTHVVQGVVHSLRLLILLSIISIIISITSIIILMVIITVIITIIVIVVHI